MTGGLRVALARLRGRGRVELGAGVRLGKGVRLEVARGARLRVGDRVELAERCRAHVRAGEAVIGEGTRLGPECVLAVCERVELGAGCRLQDGVVLIDHDHVAADPERPVREQGVVTAPIRLGDGVIVDRGAAILRGVTAGAGARVLAHAVVTSDIAAGATAGGVPARRPPAAPVQEP